MMNWSGEFAKWAVRMIAYKGSPAQRRALQGDLRMGQFQVLLTTTNTLSKIVRTRLVTVFFSR
jgi:ATP-dependent helicase STH1/SNF2